jgi:hypothetical protein
MRNDEQNVSSLQRQGPRAQCHHPAASAKQSIVLYHEKKNAAAMGTTNKRMAIDREEKIAPRPAKFQ